MFKNPQIKKDLINWTDIITGYRYSDNIYFDFDSTTITITTDGATSLLNSRASEIQKILKAYLFKKYKLDYNLTFIAGHSDKINYLRLRTIALNAAKEVRQTGIKISLANLDAGERKIVHKILSKEKDIKTKSLGGKNDRTLQIINR